MIMGMGVQMFERRIFDKKLNSKLLHPYRIYKYLMVQYLNKYNKYAKCIIHKIIFYVCESVFQCEI